MFVGVAIVDPDDSMDEMWVAVGAFPAFLCAVLFFMLRRLGDGDRRLAETSLPRAVAWAVVSGVLVGALPFAMGTPNPENPAWLGLAVIGSFSLMSAISSVASVLISRTAKIRASRGAGANLA